jgi:hypothetical protein
MLHPLLRLALADWQLRLVGWALLGAGVLLCIAFSGVALMLYGTVAAPPTPWLLWAVPVAPALLALWGAWLARRRGDGNRGASVAQQFEADLALLRARS